MGVTMRRLSLSIALLSALLVAPALAQSPSIMAQVAPTAPIATNNNQIATTAWVNTLFNSGTPLANITGLGTGVATFLATPSGANLLSALTTKTGTGVPVFGTAPNITAPTGIVKADVGLGNVANADTTNASNIGSGNLADARMPNTAWSAFTPAYSCGTATYRPIRAVRLLLLTIHRELRLGAKRPFGKSMLQSRR
jgi:hypothetical protein